ncbi:pseudouridine synthase [Sneathiella sp. P13V-1]|uniref:pseudouridine synthase n=1 Tax=Sneathiella sp. P13V-1 TaxID=2697366 RepID=UPI00187B1A42|nr:pseudouridine synthase [Sneathiella sp. P13V-1]MBE7638113.1 pseudouridine synthase [Sneathiella sp. P13V-1]
MQSKFRYIAFNKPYGVLSQFTSEGGHPALDGFNLPKGIYAAGRLDRDSEGLLLLTNDGKFIKKLLDPSFAHPRSYWVQVEGSPSKEQLSALAAGPEFKGYKPKPCKVRVLDPQPEVPDRIPPIRVRKNIPDTWIEIELTEGKNRQVRRMTAAVGCPTLRLIRKSIGKLELKKLPSGEWREVSKGDILPR